MLTKQIEARFHCAVKTYLPRSLQGKVMGDLRQVFGTPDSRKLEDVKVYAAPEVFPNHTFVDVSTLIAAMTRIEDLERQVAATAPDQLGSLLSELTRWTGKVDPKVLPLLWCCVDLNRDMSQGKSLGFAVHKAGKALAALQAMATRVPKDPTPHQEVLREIGENPQLLSECAASESAPAAQRQGEAQRLREALSRIRDHAARVMDDEVFYEADSALSAGTSPEQQGAD